MTTATATAATKATPLLTSTMVRRAALFLLLAAALPLSQAATGLSGWRSGILTNYGGPFDGKNPNEPSWGTSVVSLTFPHRILSLFALRLLARWRAQRGGRRLVDLS